ncbi:hypothetical protein RJ639_035328 [Escallonia herrerae]|uniref:Aquaporin NIP7-1 n=1 Tax=Escallonia herrerae TaxID=1293975 RepID=A0AA89BGJ8_9ASTE|nr:hypothetical protein RJ639_035328 [Escallonia herrerae]
MKQWFNDQQSPDVSHNASKSDQSYYNQEIGSNPTSGNKDSLTKVCSFRLAMDLTCARRVIAEALGTFILVFCICGIVASMHLTGGQVGLLEYAIAAALTVIVVVFSIGGISGAHVNPAVTIAFATVGPFPWSKVPLYILAQLGGSMLATYAGKLIYGVESELMITRPLQGSIAAFWVELIATFILLLLAASLSDETQIVGKLSGFMVGVAIGLGVLITGYTSKLFTCISAFNIVQSVRISKRRINESSKVTGTGISFLEVPGRMDISYGTHHRSRFRGSRVPCFTASRLELHLHFPACYRCTLSRITLASSIEIGE